MKKRRYVIASFVLAVILAFVPINAFCEHIPTTIETPMGVEVDVGCFFGEDIPQNLKTVMHDDIVEKYENRVLLLSEATVKYNCHSYAWYSQDYDQNLFRMEDPTPYFDCGSVALNSHEESNGSIGDIIVYFDELGVPIHSGIVVKTLSGTSNGVCGNADLKIVQSKWGDGGLYTHRGDVCPYSYSYNQTPSEYAFYIKYYKLKNHEHSWDVNFYNNTYDEMKCSGCSLTMYHNLTCVDDGNDITHSFSCSFCGGLGMYHHEFDVLYDCEIEGYHRGECTVCYGIIEEPHICTTYVNSNLSGYHQGTCTACGGTVYQIHNWVKMGNKYRCTICNYVTTNISAFDYEGEEVYLQ